jgi:ssDNA-binding Zn-finger/Zn-ribbon topoisomerase 1
LQANDYLPFVAVVCTVCQAVMVERHGQYGPFFGCTNFPKCRFTISKNAVNKGLNEQQWKQLQQIKAPKLVASTEDPNTAYYWHKIGIVFSFHSTVVN